MLIDFHELLDKGEERIPVECLLMGRSAEARVAFEDIIYRESKPRSTGVHTFHVHVRSEERHFTVFVSVSLHTLEKCLGILQNN